MTWQEGGSRAMVSLVRMEVVELLLRVLQPLGGVAVLLLQQRHYGGHILQIPGMRSALRDASPLIRWHRGAYQPHASPRPMCSALRNASALGGWHWGVCKPDASPRGMCSACRITCSWLGYTLMQLELASMALSLAELLLTGLTSSAGAAPGTCAAGSPLFCCAPPLPAACPNGAPAPARHRNMLQPQCSRQNLPSKVLPFVMSSPASLTCSATPGKPAAREKMPSAGFHGSSNQVEGVLPRVLPVGRTFCQRL